MGILNIYFHIFADIINRIMKQKKLKITEKDFILANRRAARMEEIERHGRQVQSRRMVHKSKKTYDRNRLKRAVIKSDDGSLFFIGEKSLTSQIYKM